MKWRTHLCICDAGLRTQSQAQHRNSVQQKKQNYDADFDPLTSEPEALRTSSSHSESIRVTLQHVLQSQEIVSCTMLRPLACTEQTAVLIFSGPLDCSNYWLWKMSSETRHAKLNQGMLRCPPTNIMNIIKE